MTSNAVHGWLVLDKPLGVTSAKAVSIVKKKLGADKIGHGGTLDPLASGILPLGLGEATKAFQYVVADEKSYAFTVRWGEERSTDDAEGEAIAQSDHRPTVAEIQAVLSHFVGHIEQLPPIFSALKVDGERAYKKARAGDEVQMKPRVVHVMGLEYKGSPDSDSADFIVHCGKGTYVRAIARDLGRVLNCYGYVSALRRLHVGKFTENRAISLDELSQMDYETVLSRYLLPVEYALDDIPGISLDAAEEKRLRQGQLARPMQAASEFKHVPVLQCRRVTDGTLIAMVSPVGGQVRSQRIFNL